MTRIISGLAGGRRIQVPSGTATRPTSDRVREGLFAMLEHLDVLADAAVLDLYAGSGALGLEAASRGAARVVLVESARAALLAARANVKDLGLSDVTVHAEVVERFLVGGAAAYGPFDLVLADPPYELGEGALGDALALVVGHGWLGRDGLLVLERSARSPEPRWPVGLELVDERRYGETKLWFAERPTPPVVA